MNATNFMNEMFGKVAPGMCRLTPEGRIAVKTSNGDYKTYNSNTGRLTNCTNFVFAIADDFFFVVPTTKVNEGDIILVDNGSKKSPRFVKEANGESLVVINYDTNAIETILPDRHIFMGDTYFYGKIVSMFGQNISKKGGINNIFKYMFMMEMMKGASNNGTSSDNNNGMFNSNNMLPMMMFMNNGDMFNNLFDFDLDGIAGLGSEEPKETKEKEDAETK